MYGLRRMYRRLRNDFGHHRWNLTMMRFKWKLVSVGLEIVQILKQDRCMVCPEHTIGSKIILDAPDVTPR